MPEAGHVRAPILIAGAGIAGLALALALARRGLACRVLEHRRILDEEGAGIQLGPNAMQVLTRLGVAERLEYRAGRPEAIDVSDALTGRPLARLPLGDAMTRRFGAPYRVAHRADLQAALLGAARDTPDVEIAMGFDVTSTVRQDGGLVVVSAFDGRTMTGRMLVGADGQWSAVRQSLFPDFKLNVIDKKVLRALIPADVVAPRFARAATAVWLAPRAHIVHYPVRGGREIAVIVVLTSRDAPHVVSTGTTRAGAVRELLAGADPELLAFLAHVETWNEWYLYDPAPLPAWSKGNVGLIGDAAHPILPFLAQGGAMALEDAETLAKVLAAYPNEPAEAFQRFELLRRARVLRVVAASRENGRVFHLGGAMGLARNLVLRAAPGGLMMRRYDWLYGWNGDGVG